jgi:hypothetical protein
MFVNFSSINLAPMMACVLVAMALVLPCMGVAFVVSLVEEMYWVNLFGEEVEVAHFVLPPEIACLPLELPVYEVGVVPEFMAMWDTLVPTIPGQFVLIGFGEQLMASGSVPPRR